MPKKQEVCSDISVSLPSVILTKRTMSESWYNNKTEERRGTAKIIQLVFLRIPDLPFASLNTKKKLLFFHQFNYLNIFLKQFEIFAI